MNQEQFESFLAFLSRFYAFDLIKSEQTHEVVAIKIYIEIKKFNKDFLTEYINDNHLEVQIHIPSEIWDGQEWYYVGVNDYDADIEFITLFIL